VGIDLQRVDDLGILQHAAVGIGTHQGGGGQLVAVDARPVAKGGGKGIVALEVVFKHGLLHVPRQRDGILARHCIVRHGGREREWRGHLHVEGEGDCCVVFQVECGRCRVVAGPLHGHAVVAGIGLYLALAAGIELDGAVAQRVVGLGDVDHLAGKVLSSGCRHLHGECLVALLRAQGKRQCYKQQQEYDCFFHLDDCSVIDLISLSKKR
jgi:hypothetical protein